MGLNKNLDQRSILIAMNHGFTVTKPIIRSWLKSKYKVGIFVQPFGTGYIGTIRINNENIALGDESKAYFNYKTEDDCFFALLERVFEILNT